MKILNLIFAVLAISVFVSCEKDNDSNPTKKSYRVKQAISHFVGDSSDYK